MTRTVVGSELLWEGTTPEAVRDASTGRAARARVREELFSMLTRDAVLGACRIRRAKFKPGRKLTVHIEVRARSEVDDVTRQVVVRWRPDGGLPEGAARSGGDDETKRVPAPGAPASDISHPFERLHGHLPDLHAEILVSPFDPQLPSLHELADPASVGRQLTADGSGDRSCAFGVHTIRYRPGERHVLKYVPLDPAAESVGIVFAKLGRDSDPARMGIIAARAAEVLEASEPSTSAARALHEVAGANVLLLAGVGGRPLSEMLRRGHLAAVPHVLRVGRALRTLHTGSPADDWGSPGRSEPQTSAAHRASEHIASLLPDVGMKIVEMLERAESAFDEIDAPAPTLVHGDLKADHVFIDRNRMSFVDLGPLGTGDPAMDVGKFLADLRWWLSPHSLPGREARAAFLQGYGGRSDHPRMLRARVWESVLLLSIAAHRVPIWDAAWERRTRCLFGEAERTLHETVRPV